MELGKYKLAMRPKKYLTREFVVYKAAPEAMDDVITEEQNIIDTMPSQAPAMDNYMPEIPGMEDPSLRQIALADGGVVQREGFRIGGEALIKAYNFLKQKLGRAPSVSEMQEKTKTYRNTILKELPDYDFTDLRTLEQPAEVGAARQEGIQKSLEQKAKEKYKNKPYVRFLGGKRGQSTSKVSEVVFPNEALEEKYLNFLLEKYSYPGSSPSNPITNEFLSKQFNISPYTIDRINGFYKKQLNLKYPKGKSKLETTQKRNENLKKARLYLGGKKYQNINKSQEQIKIIQNDYYKNNPKEILKNKNLIDLLNLKLVNGKIISKNKTEKELLDITQSERGVFDIDHISEVQDAKINTEYPINRQWIPYNTNSGFVKSIRTYVDKNPDDVEGIKEIEKVLEKFNIRVKTNKGIIGPKEIPAVDETNNIMPNFLKNLQIYGAKIPKKQLQQYQKQLPGVAGKAAATGATTLALTTLANAETPDAVIPEQGGLNKTQAGVLAGAGTVATKTGRKILGKGAKLGLKGAALANELLLFGSTPLAAAVAVGAEGFFPAKAYLQGATEDEILAESFIPYFGAKLLGKDVLNLDEAQQKALLDSALPGDKEKVKNYLDYLKIRKDLSENILEKNEAKQELENAPKGVADIDLEGLQYEYGKANQKVEDLTKQFYELKPKVDIYEDMQAFKRTLFRNVGDVEYRKYKRGLKELDLNKQVVDTGDVLPKDKKLSYENTLYDLINKYTEGTNLAPVFRQGDFPSETDIYTNIMLEKSPKQIEAEREAAIPQMVSPDDLINQYAYGGRVGLATGTIPKAVSWVAKRIQDINKLIKTKRAKAEDFLEEIEILNKAEELNLTKEQVGQILRQQKQAATEKYLKRPIEGDPDLESRLPYDPNATPGNIKKRKNVYGKYKFTGNESLEDLYELERLGKITRMDMNVYDPRYVEWLDAQIINKEKLYTPKEWENTPEVLKNKMRGRIDPDWETANFGEDFDWDRARSTEIQQTQKLKDFDITGRSKNAYGGRINFEKGSDPKDKPILPINPMIGGEDPRGSLQDPGRRDVLKGMGLLGAGVAAGKLGLLGLSKVAKKAPLTEIVAPMGKTTTEFPTWFPSLIKRVREEGTQIPIFKKVDVPLTETEFNKLQKQGAKGIEDRYQGRSEEYIKASQARGEPRYIQTQDTDEIIGYRYEVKEMPGLKVKDMEGKEIEVEFPNAYGQEVYMTYTKPKISIDPQGQKIKYDAEFYVDDGVPELNWMGMRDDHHVDFYAETVKNIDEVLGGASKVEQYALKAKKPRITSGDEIVSRSDAAYDIPDDFD